MLTIKTKTDFDSMLKDEQAVLFTFYETKRSSISLGLVEEWEREQLRQAGQLKIYRLDPDQNPYARDWLEEQADSDGNMERGFGSISWLKCGRRVGFEPYAAKAGKEVLTRLTDGHLHWTDFNAARRPLAA